MANTQEALAEAQGLMDNEGVVGVGEGKIGTQACITVWVVRRTPELEEKIPRVIKGVPVDIQESGTFTAD